MAELGEDPLGVDPYLFPARGRKPAVKAAFDVVSLTVVDPYLFPARGRKRGGLD